MVINMVLSNLFSALAKVNVALLVSVLVYFVAVYIYTALALMKIADKTKVKTPKWFAWVPILNWILTVDEAGLPTAWALVFLATFIPYVGGLVVGIFELFLFWKISERLKKPGAYALWNLVPLIGPFVSLGLIAWYKSK